MTTENTTEAEAFDKALEEAEEEVNQKGEGAIDRPTDHEVVDKVDKPNLVEINQRVHEAATQEILSQYEDEPEYTEQMLAKDKEDSAKLAEFVKKNHLAITKEKGLYLKAEAWQYLARLKHITPSYRSKQEILNTTAPNGAPVRYLQVETTCDLLDEYGDLVSSSTMIANSCEAFLKDKPAYAVWGMSQTRAFSRAIRNIYGYVACDAGFQTTPVDEMGE